ncbi:hypothetical protein [Achromobacter xylosoxidans]|uniref:hypothetical protein n=1 Tax=Alcaligenes xylosoxydans xylosoxydans TaxID=85698 RepID=UPI001F0654F5|nr:hypothetical protein [Achromobacter xylosoxidans]MCH1984832.1 hypothetical protein [Achromobacter xylosoxidans]MCH4589501.1 hypothetical protein [Achromobacter xylosoxidans]
MRKAILFATCISLAGCTTYDMTLMSQKSGAMGKGQAKANGTTATIELNGKTYSGPFFYRSDATYSVPSISLADNLPPPMEAKREKLGFVGGNGSVFAKAADGSGLRCLFALNPRLQMGSGACLDDAGMTYDMQIN